MFRKIAKFAPRPAALGLALAFGAVSILGAASAAAQGYPSKVISFIVPFPPGGTTDVLARAIANDLSKSIGQPIIVENKPGAGATIGADFVAKSKPDGHTLLMGAVHHTIASSVYKKLPYDFQKDLTPVTMVAMVPNVMVVNPQVPAKSVKELVAQAKTAPGKLTYGSNGAGTAQHLIGAQFEQSAGVSLIHVPYKGSGPLATDLLGGQIDMTFDTITPVLQHIRSGKLRALAVTTAKRSPALPDVPTLDESGLKGFNIGTWFGVLAPAGTPPEIVGKLNTEINKVMQTAEFRKRMDEIGAEPIGNSAAQMAGTIRTDTDRFAKLVKDAKVSLE